MGLEVVVILDLFIGCLLNLSERVEEICVQYFFPIAFVKALDEGVLVWLTRLNVAEFNPAILGPFNKFMRRYFGAIIQTNGVRLTGLSRTALYRPREDRLKRDEPVMDALNGIIKKRPRWGFWKCFDRIRLDGHGFNHKRVHRVYCDMKLNMKRRTKKRIADRPRQPLDHSQALNRNWSLDFMRDTLYDGRIFRTFNVIDEGNREALRIEVGTSMSAIRVVRIMDELIDVYGKPAGLGL